MKKDNFEKITSQIFKIEEDKVCQPLYVHGDNSRPLHSFTTIFAYCDYILIN